MGEKILVLGSNSFLGQNFSRMLNERSDSVYTVSRNLSDACFSENHFRGDVFNPSFFQSVLREVDPSVVVNFVGSADSSCDLHELKTINMGVLKLWDQLASREENFHKKFITMGSAAEYGKSTTNPLGEDAECVPASSYGESKKQQTDLALKLIEEKGAQIFVVRPFNLMGKKSPPSLISEKIREKVSRLTEHENLVLDDPEMVRDFIDVDDFSDALAALMSCDASAGIYNICSGVGVMLSELGEVYIQASGKNGEVVRAANPAFRSEVRSAVGSVDKLRKVSGWSPNKSLLQSALAQSR